MIEKTRPATHPATTPCESATRPATKPCKSATRAATQPATKREKEVRIDNLTRALNYLRQEIRKAKSPYVY